MKTKRLLHKISFVSTNSKRRLYVRSRDHECPLQTGQRLKKKSMGVGWGKFYEHGVEARPCGKRPSFRLLSTCM